MIQKLRRRFILISVAVLSVAMLSLALTINLVNWFSVRQDLSDTTDELASTAIGYERGSGKSQKKKHGESIYESRYFVVTIKNGSISADLTNVSSYTEEEAQAMAEAVQSSSTDSGLISDCYYRKYTVGSRTAILFLDCGTKLDAVRQLGWISLLACAAGILISWLLMLLFSRRAIRPVLENTEKQKRFITDASHELKTPLAVISANMDVMAMDDPENEWILSTRRQVGLMNRMVRDLVFLTRADEGRLQPVHSDFDLAQLLRETADPFVQMAEAGGRSFRVTVPDSLPFRGDPKGIERLISVLCDNAVKYSPENDALSISLNRTGSFAVIETANTPAEAIDEEKLKHLFDRFYRADESRTKKGEKTGFGIGLAIAQAVAEAHGGSTRAWMQGGRIHICCRMKIS